MVLQEKYIQKNTTNIRFSIHALFSFVKSPNENFGSFIYCANMKMMHAKAFGKYLREMSQLT
jgi:hypothetical protein